MKKGILIVAGILAVVNVLWAQVDTTDTGGGVGAPGIDWMEIVSYVLNIILGIIGTTWVPKVKGTKDKVVALADTVLNGLEDGKVDTREVVAARNALRALIAKEKE
jgi:hypothetical protein